MDPIENLTLEDILKGIADARRCRLVFLNHDEEGESALFTAHLINAAASTLENRNSETNYIDAFCTAATLPSTNNFVPQELLDYSLSVVDGHLFFDKKLAPGRFSESLLAKVLGGQTFIIKFVLSPQDAAIPVYFHYNFNFVFTKL